MVFLSVVFTGNTENMVSSSIFSVNGLGRKAFMPDDRYISRSFTACVAEVPTTGIFSGVISSLFTDNICCFQSIKSRHPDIHKYHGIITGFNFFNSLQSVCCFIKPNIPSVEDGFKEQPVIFLIIHNQYSWHS